MLVRLPLHKILYYFWDGGLARVALIPSPKTAIPTSTKIFKIKYRVQDKVIKDFRKNKQTSCEK